VQIFIENAGKKFNAEWVLRGLNLHFRAGRNYAFTGANGSGKSTLIQLMTGQCPLSEGKIRFVDHNGPIDEDSWFRYVVLAAPYLELVEEFTLSELVAFHSRFKPLKNKLPVSGIIDFARLSTSRDKPVRYFSSGMKQRLKLALAFQTDVPVVFLDEPTSNLDAEGIRWYRESVSGLTENQLLVIGSNQEYEYDFCGEIIPMSRFK